MKNKFNIQYRKNQSALSILIFLAGLMLFGLCQMSPAQIVRTSPPLVRATPPPPPAKKAIVFKGSGVMQPRPESQRLRQLSFPATLSAARSSAALREAMSSGGVTVMGGEMPLETYVMLNPQTSYVAGKGSIDFVRPLMVDARNNLVGYTESGSGFDLYIKPDRAGRWFLINCGVNALAGSPFRIFGPDGTIAESSINGSGNLQAFIVSQNTEWQKIGVDRPSGWWFLSSCQVTTPAQ